MLTLHMSSVALLMIRAVQQTYPCASQHFEAFARQLLNHTLASVTSCSSHKHLWVKLELDQGARLLQELFYSSPAGVKLLRQINCLVLTVLLAARTSLAWIGKTAMAAKLASKARFPGCSACNED